MMKHKKYRILFLDLALLAAAAVAWPLSGWMLRWLPPCPFPAMGFLCPACGSTRCIRYLVQGQLGDAFAMNPFLFLLLGYIAAALLLLNIGILLDAPKTERIARSMLSWRFVLISGILFGLFGILRNFL